ncbi:MAG: IPT/TIG domain-containing protein [Candidatus Nomurabacteria bacterium]|nr:IPT/TIG domain-containing protein [Candidatus Nomurabacteria bacterium]
MAVVGAGVLRARPVYADSSAFLNPATISLIGNSSTAVNLSVDPSSASFAGSTYLYIMASTNVATGLNVSISSDSDDTSLHNSSGSTIKTISKSGTLGNNSWGYIQNTATSDATYNPIPPASDPAALSAIVSGTESFVAAMGFGVKVDHSVSAGTYSGSVVYTATAVNPLPEPSLPQTGAVSPSSGYTNQTLPITISGTNLNYTAGVFVDFNGNGVEDSGEACSNGAINDVSSSSTTITCDAPATATAGTYNVVVDTQGGEATAVQALTYKKSTIVEQFKFTVNTALDDSGGDTATGTTFAIPTSNADAYDWNVDWGDGDSETDSGTGSKTSAGISHTYAAAGSYQITIKPAATPASGWLQAFGFYSGTSGANAQANKDLFYTIDTPFTALSRTVGASMFADTFYGTKNLANIPADLFENINTTGAANFTLMFAYTFYQAAYNSTDATIPSGLFDTITTSSGTNFMYMFYYTFYYYGYSSTVLTIPSGLLSGLDTSHTTVASSGFLYMFGYMFSYAGCKSTAAQIPAGLFDGFVTVAGPYLMGTFYHTFYYYGYSSTVLTIPSGLFSGVTLSSSSPTNLFGGTFAYCGHNSTVGTIPADLFQNLGGSSTTAFSSLFYQTFQGYANASTVGTIPADLFAGLNTAKGTSFSDMFYDTFNGYAQQSTAATIPAGLFSTITTPLGTDFSGMFQNTFAGLFAYKNAAATIPADLFSGISTTNATNLSSMFYGTFEEFGFGVSGSATIPTGLFSTINVPAGATVTSMFESTFFYFQPNGTGSTNINDVWQGATLTGLTAANTGGTSGALYQTFSYMKSLTGTAQTFIDDKLGGLVPASEAKTFANSGVSDLANLDANWK